MFRSNIGHRSDAQKKEDEAFMAALDNIHTLEAKGGQLSMDASDLKEQLEALHEAGKRFVKE